MIITIRDKHTGSREDYEDLYELFTDSENIHVVIKTKSGWTKTYSFDKKDYEIFYIG